MRPIINDDGSTDVAISQVEMTRLRKARGLAFLIKNNVVPGSFLKRRAEAAEEAIHNLLLVLEKRAEGEQLRDQTRKDDATSDLTEPTGFEEEAAARPDGEDMADAATR